MDIKPPPKKQPQKIEIKDDTLIEDQVDGAGIELSEPPKETPEPDDSPKIEAKPAPAKVKKGRLSHLKWWLKTHKKIAIPLAILIVLGLGGGAYALFGRSAPKPIAPPVVKAEPKPEPPKPTTVPSPLTGVPVSPELAARPVTGMMIENSPEARPQSGLVNAGTVFEATAEGGITRFLALWQEDRPGNIGPCRSLRPYYIDWALPFQAGVGHVGGSPQALQEASDVGLRDLDQFANGGSYHRTSDRYAPHNMYTNSDDMDKLQAAKGYTKSEFAPWPRKPEAGSAAPTTSKISFDISSQLFHVDYNYDKATNRYMRVLAGAQHKDRESGNQLSPKVVVILKMAHRLVDSQHYGITTVGSGEAFIFQDGIQVKGTWKKDSRSSMFHFLDANGKDIPLNIGQVWVSIIPADRNPVVTP